MYYTFIRRKKL